MRSIDGVGLEQVRGVYDGPEGDLWELVMGEQIHIGGMASSMDLAEKAGIRGAARGIDLCCCTGAGMRCLVRLMQVGRMVGVDATRRVIELGRERCREQGFGDSIDFVEAEATGTGLPGGEADFVWGEDAWCYVSDKPALIREAARLVRPGGAVAFTDWVEGDTPLEAAEAERFQRFMKFPTFETVGGYRGLMSAAGLRVERAELTGRFAAHARLYIDMLEKQMTYDALRIIGFDMGLMAAMGQEMRFMLGLAEKGKIEQGLFVARKSG
ncbi:MAG TPA: methyltransferase domain-containing protein [Verrucomicrobiae bacterium]|nr:methyltransferase domain-containing protein [Verrucomicrobiae bacterium]